MKARIALAALTIILLITVVSTLVLLPAGDTAKGHSGGHNFVIGGTGNSLAHWSDGGMDYSFHTSVPTI